MIWTPPCVCWPEVCQTRGLESRAEEQTPPIPRHSWSGSDNMMSIVFMTTCRIVYLLLAWHWPLPGLAVEPRLKCDVMSNFCVSHSISVTLRSLSFFSQRLTIPYSSCSYSTSDRHKSGRSEAPGRLSWHGDVGLWLVSTRQCSALIGHWAWRLWWS